MRIACKRAAVALTTVLSALSAANVGGIFLTGHDPDYHAVAGANAAGAQHIIQDGVSFVTFGKVNPHMLLVTDTRNPGGDEVDSRLGVTAAGFTYDVADDGTAGGSVLDLHTVNFSNYDVVVVASDYGGWLRQSELTILDSRGGDIASYVNNGGGLVAFSESGTNLPTNLADRFLFAPEVAVANQDNQGESGFTVTPFGSTLGLVDSDVNGNASHSIFTSYSPLYKAVDVDPFGHVLSIATRGSAVPEPAPMLAIGAGVLGLMCRRVRRGV